MALSKSRPVKMLHPFPTHIQSWRELQMPLLYTDAAIFYMREHVRGALYVEADPNMYIADVPAVYFPAGVPTPVPVWTAGAKVLGDYTRPSVQNGFIYECVAAGATGAGEPAWDLVLGGFTIDAGVIWITRTPWAIGTPVDLTSKVFVGQPIKWLVAGDSTFYYGMISAIHADYLEYRGAPMYLGTSIDQLTFGNPYLTARIRLATLGASTDALDNFLLNGILGAAGWGWPVGWEGPTLKVVDVAVAGHISVPLDYPWLNPHQNNPLQMISAENNGFGIQVTGAAFAHQHNTALRVAYATIDPGAEFELACTAAVAAPGSCEDAVCELTCVVADQNPYMGWMPFGSQ